MGAWIETLFDRAIYTMSEESHPVWVRGLKLDEPGAETLGGVAPRVGAWIETILKKSFLPVLVVAPRVGAWIETIKTTLKYDTE